MTTTAPSAIGGNRLTWPDLPADLRDRISAAVGAPVTGAVSQPGGFSPGLASVLTLADGRRVFAKAANPARNEFTVAAIRREAEVLRLLPPTVPAPRPYWDHDDGDWVVLLTEAVDGRTPEQPWRPDELARYLAATTVLAEHLTPSPIVAEHITDAYAAEFTSWAALAAVPGGGDRLDPWTRHHLERLAELEAPWALAAAGDALLHCDLRADNLMLTADGFTVVDWPSACVGAPWLDLFLALPSVSMHGGGDPDALWSAHPLSTGVDPDAVNAMIAAFAGLMISRASLPVPPLLPTIREFQRAQGWVALTWLATRLHWPH